MDKNNSLINMYLYKINKGKNCKAIVFRKPGYRVNGNGVRPVDIFLDQQIDGLINISTGSLSQRYSY